ncbi:TPA: hypothetical protein DD617_02695 [Candidatus Uhrbacteria bacterium]|nr:hypothetical protein [Candidatus Uhrbacteria bacterium]
MGKAQISYEEVNFANCLLTFRLRRILPDVHVLIECLLLQEEEDELDRQFLWIPEEGELAIEESGHPRFRE